MIRAVGREDLARHSRDRFSAECLAAIYVRDQAGPCALLPLQSPRQLSCHPSHRHLHGCEVRSLSLTVFLLVQGERKSRLVQG